MTVKFVSHIELHDNLSRYGLGGIWYGAYFGDSKEILIDKELNIFRLISTFIHEMIHWLIHVIGLRYKGWYADQWFDLFAGFFEIIKGPRIKRAIMKQYWDEIKSGVDRHQIKRPRKVGPSLSATSFQSNSFATNLRASK